jgi:hypothetical protein
MRKKQKSDMYGMKCNAMSCYLNTSWDDGSEFIFRNFYVQQLQKVHVYVDIENLMWRNKHSLTF